MVSFKNVEKKYPDGTVAVDGLNLDIKPGEFVVLIGPSGCGKTTTLKMINRLEECTSGQINVNGKDIMSLNPVLLRREIGYVIQERGLMPHHTVGENIGTVPQLLGWPKDKIDKRIDELLEMAGLSIEKYKYRLPGQMSGGQQQRIGVLRALASDPEVVLMDEPFGALDPISRESLQNELLDIHKKLKKTIIFVTHDISEALKLADRIVIMRQGKIEQVDTPEEILNNPATKFVETFIGSEQLSQISPESSVEGLIEEVIYSMGLNANIRDVLEKMQDMDIKSGQVLNTKGKWCGSVYMSTLKKAKREGGLKVNEALHVNRKLFIEEANLRDAAEMLIDKEGIPIPILNASNELLGIVTENGLAKYTINKLIK
jgi:osmoprotectant transport system ATP-binding protein